MCWLCCIALLYNRGQPGDQLSMCSPSVKGCQSIQFAQRTDIRGDLMLGAVGARRPCGPSVQFWENRVHVFLSSRSSFTASQSCWKLITRARRQHTQQRLRWSGCLCKRLYGRHAVIEDGKSDLAAMKGNLPTVQKKKALYSKRGVLGSPSIQMRWKTKL